MEPQMNEEEKKDAQEITISPEAQQGEELKYPTYDEEDMSLLADYHDNATKTQSKQQQQSMHVYEIIPYRSDYASSAVSKFYPFNGEENKGGGHYVDHTVISTIIGVISLFSTITQILFVIYAPEPYRWISLTLLLIAQIMCSILFCMTFAKLMDTVLIDTSIGYAMICLFGCLFIPLSHIALPILFKIYQSKDERTPLIIRTAPCLAISMIQSYPQIVMMMVMISVGDYNLLNNSSKIVNCTFLASLLSVITLIIQISSIFKQRIERIVTSIWLLFDFVLTITVILVISYDSTTFIIMCVDVALYCIWLLIFVAIVFALSAKKLSQRTMLVKCFITITNVLMSGFIMVITMYFYLFSFVWFAIMDELYGWNVCPMSSKCDGNRTRYSLFEWIQNGKNTEEQNDRLQSVNIVILDNNERLRVKYNQLCNDIVTNIRTSIASKNKSLTQMISVMNKFNVLTFQIDNKYKNMFHILGNSRAHNIIKWLIIYFQMNRILHFIVPFLIITYAIISAKLKSNNSDIDILLQVLFSLTLILFVIFIFSFYIGWQSWYYYRLILPINNPYDDMNMKWKLFSTHVANCHFYVTSLKVIADWCVSGGGDKYIAYVIMNFMGITKDKQFAGKYKLLLLGAGEVGKSTILRQVRFLYGRQFSESELLATKPHLQQNVMEAMRTLAIYSVILSDEGKETYVSNTNQDVRCRVARMNDKQKFTQEHCDDLTILWREPGIKELLKYKHTFQLHANHEYLFENMSQYVRDDYIPTFCDLLHSYQRTTGINKTRYTLRYEQCEQIWELYDNGGQKTERKKWIHFFPNTTAVIFVVNLSGFCETLWEDGTNNSLKEDIGLFRGVVNLDVLKNCKWYVILNKYDLLKKNMRNCNMDEYFNDFHGNNNNEQEIIEFVKQKLRNQRKAKYGNKIWIEFFVTNALDTKCIKSVFDGFHEDIGSVPPEY